MLNRRAAILGGLSLLPQSGLAQQGGASSEEAQAAPAQPDRDLVPNELGRADFADAFRLERAGTFALVADVRDIPGEVVEGLADVRFASAGDIDGYFRDRRGSGFIPWFNRSVAGRSEWAGKSVAAADAPANFTAYWDRSLSDASVGLFDFLAYMSVFINECDGNLVSVSERYGSAEHPGLSYLFDGFRIQSANGREWSKKSYNLAPLNRTAGGLFRDALFDGAHGHLPPAASLRGTDDPVWDGTDYPKARMPTSADPRLTGYLQQADFFKFRGRGLIQTTWRANYRKLVDKVVRYTGDSEVLQGYARAWAGTDPDEACTRSTSADWDRLFSEPGKFLLCEAIRQHADDGRYFPLRANAYDLNGAGSGSLQLMGNRIGGIGYGLRLKARVRQLCLALA